MQTPRPPPNLASPGPTEFDPVKFRLSDKVRAPHQRIVLDAEICKQFLKTTLLKWPDKNIQYWREALEENVDRICKKALDDSRQETLASGSRVDNKNSNNRPDAAGSAPEKDGDEGKNEDRTTCLSNLAGVLRPELHQHYGRINKQQVRGKEKEKA
ncbi:hypothetical protein BGZ98_007505 [Dissophora globulifera]|nr:hypothetical protein BGZ98_007505 [Dissophora globulifera]